MGESRSSEPNRGGALCTQGNSNVIVKDEKKKEDSRSDLADAPCRFPARS